MRWTHSADICILPFAQRSTLLSVQFSTSVARMEASPILEMAFRSKLWPSSRLQLTTSRSLWHRADSFEAACARQPVHSRSRPRQSSRTEGNDETPGSDLQPHYGIRCLSASVIRLWTASRPCRNWVAPLQVFKAHRLRGGETREASLLFAMACARQVPVHLCEAESCIRQCLGSASVLESLGSKGLVSDVNMRSS